MHASRDDSTLHDPNDACLSLHESKEEHESLSLGILNASFACLWRRLKCRQNLVGKFNCTIYCNWDLETMRSRNIWSLKKTFLCLFCVFPAKSVWWTFYSSPVCDRPLFHQLTVHLILVDRKNFEKAGLWKSSSQSWIAAFKPQTNVLTT